MASPGGGIRGCHVVDHEGGGLRLRGGEVGRDNVNAGVGIQVVILLGEGRLEIPEPEA